MPSAMIGVGVGLPWNHHDIASTPNITLSGVPPALFDGDCAAAPPANATAARTAAILSIAIIVVRIPGRFDVVRLLVRHGVRSCQRAANAPSANRKLFPHGVASRRSSRGLCVVRR